MRTTDSSPRSKAHARAVEITIRFAELAPPIGEAGASGGERRPFVGWLGLLALLTELLEAQPPTEVLGSLGGEGHSRAQGDLGQDV